MGMRKMIQYDMLRVMTKCTDENVQVQRPSYHSGASHEKVHARAESSDAAGSLSLLAQEAPATGSGVGTNLAAADAPAGSPLPPAQAARAASSEALKQRGRRTPPHLEMD